MHSSSTTGFVNPSSAALSLVPDAAGIAILRRVHSIRGMYKACILALFLSFLLTPLTGTYEPELQP